MASHSSYGKPLEFLCPEMPLKAFAMYLLNAFNVLLHRFLAFG